MRRSGAGIIAIGVVGLALLAIGITQWTHGEGGRAIILAVVGVLFAIFAIYALSVSPYVAGYYTCVAAPGTCPAAIGGSGYVCTNENSVCEQGSGDAQDLRCKTVAKAHWWESDCECKCVP